MNYPYRYAWKNNAKRKTLYGRRCHVLVRTKICNSAMVEFDHGQREIISRNALRRVKDG